MRLSYYYFTLQIKTHFPTCCIKVYRMIITGIMGHSSRGDRIHRISFRLGIPVPRACVSWWAPEAWDQKICEDVTIKVKLKDKCLIQTRKIEND